MVTWPRCVVVVLVLVLACADAAHLQTTTNDQAIELQEQEQQQQHHWQQRQQAAYELVNRPYFLRSLQEESVDNNEQLFGNKELDELLKSFPPGVFDGLAIAGIVLGLLLAFFGLRILWLTAFVCGAVVGGFAGALVLNYIDGVTGDVSSCSSLSCTEGCSCL
jgi:hypothetical protein